jgi:starch phosphorylase
MNEGHSVFLALQRIQTLVREQNLKFEEAFEVVTANTIFTTHTPVPAGNDAFPLHIKDKYFQKYWESVGINRHQFMELGSQIQPEGYEIFNLTILALNFSRFRNGVSKLHGEVSRNLWKTVWPDVPPQEVLIDHITNGVHFPSWIARKTRELYSKYLNDEWLNHQDDKEYWAGISKIPDQAIWELKLELKKKMLNHIREKLSYQYERNKIGSLQILRIKQYMKPEVLTIGFARRFATYKRGTLIFRNLERFKKLLNDSDRPIQFIFAGKAHPKDAGGQDLIRQIHQFSMSPEFRGKVVFVENYDMGLARDLVSGVDVWLNTPRRTQEASGTSGQKAAMNGTLNFSILDGWWNEGFSPENGWAFGDKEHYKSFEEWDSWDSDELYDVLENDIIPMYYERNENNIPEKWIAKVKNSLQTVTPHYNTNRMIKQYVEMKYLPAYELGKNYLANDFQIARDVALWKDKIENHWSGVSIETSQNLDKKHASIVLKYGEAWKVEVSVKLGQLKPEHVKVQIYLLKGKKDLLSDKEFEIFEMKVSEKIESNGYKYQAEIIPSDSGNYSYTIRIIPYHKDLVNPMELGIIEWFNNEK